MIERDFVLRQIHQLMQVLQQVILHKRAKQPEQAQEMLVAGLTHTLGLELEDLRSLPRERLLALCTSDGALSGEKAVAVADLLREDDSAAGRERALWLYEAALSSGEVVPFDVYERMESLSEESGRPPP